MTADEARKVAAAARESKIKIEEREAMDRTVISIAKAATNGDTKLELQVPKEFDNAIRLKLRALGYKAEWGQMTANQTFIRVSWE